MSKWVGESERMLREIFKKAKQVAPSIIFIDEIDAIAPVRGRGVTNEVTERIVSQLLTLMSGLEEMKGVFVLAATNRPDIVDPALLRPGRFDKQILVPVPDEKARLEIFKIHTRGMPLAKDVNLEELAKKTEGYSGADIEAVCRAAAMRAMRRAVKRIEEIRGKKLEEAEKVKDKTKERMEIKELLKKLPPEVEKELLVTKEDFEKALEEIPPSVSEELNKLYEKIMEARKRVKPKKKEEKEEISYMA